MAEPVVTAEDVLELLRKFPARERLRVIARALPEIEQELPEKQPPARTLEGLWKGLGFDVTDEDIEEIRREMWSNFPHEDI